MLVALGGAVILQALITLAKVLRPRTIYGANTANPYNSCHFDPFRLRSGQAPGEIPKMTIFNASWRGFLTSFGMTNCRILVCFVH
jgi:hypothetical protein